MAASMGTQSVGNLSRLISHLFLKRSLVTSPTLFKGTRKLKYADADQLPKAKKASQTSRGPQKAYTLDEVEALLSKRFPPLDKRIEGKVPVDDVWIAEYYPPVYHKLQDCIRMHRDTCCKEMFNNENGVVYTNLLLCMRTKKKTKFQSHYAGTVLLPHLFDTDKPKTKILALSASKDELNVAKSYGAAVVGGAEIIREVASGELALDDEDISLVVCTTDLLQQLMVIKDKIPLFPSKKLFTTGHDMQSMMNLHANGVTYESVTSRLSRRDTENPTIQRLTVPIGRLGMSMEQLRENWKCWKNTLNGLRNVPALGPVILEAQVTCPPSPEKFLLDLPQSRGFLDGKDVDDDDDDDDDDDEAEG